MNNLLDKMVLLTERKELVNNLLELEMEHQVFSSQRKKALSQYEHPTGKLIGDNKYKTILREIIFCEKRCKEIDLKMDDLIEMVKVVESKLSDL